MEITKAHPRECFYSIHEEHCKKIIITEGVSRTLQKSNIAQKNKVFQ